MPATLYHCLFPARSFSYFLYALKVWLHTTGRKTVQISCNQLHVQFCFSCTAVQFSCIELAGSGIESAGQLHVSCMSVASSCWQLHGSCSPVAGQVHGQ